MLLLKFKHLVHFFETLLNDQMSDKAHLGKWMHEPLRVVMSIMPTAVLALRTVFPHHRQLMHSWTHPHSHTLKLVWQDSAIHTTHNTRCSVNQLQLMLVSIMNINFSLMFTYTHHFPLFGPRKKKLVYLGQLAWWCGQRTWMWYKQGVKHTTSYLTAWFSNFSSPLQLSLLSWSCLWIIEAHYVSLWQLMWSTIKAYPPPQFYFIRQ